MSQFRRAARICFDLVIFVAVCCGVFIIHKWFEPVQRGFFCDDESLQYPYHENTVSITLLLIVVLSVPGLVILSVEMFRQISPGASGSAAATGAAGADKRNSPISGYRMGHRCLQTIKHLGYFLFGLALTLAATDFTKHSVGRLRPHFFAVCQPQLPDGTTCDNPVNHGRYIEHYTCLMDGSQMSTPSMLNQIHKSFPSGHASLVFYAMFYIAIYLQATLSTRASKLLKHLLQFVFVMSAVYVGLTRISDYWHHWSDVFVGAALGTFIAFMITVHVANVFDGYYNVTTGRYKGRAKCEKGSTSSSAKTTATVLPAYTFGTMPYVPHYTTAQPYGQTYHNYGYVP